MGGAWCSGGGRQLGIVLAERAGRVSVTGPPGSSEAAAKPRAEARLGGWESLIGVHSKPGAGSEQVGRGFHPYEERNEDAAVGTITRSLQRVSQDAGQEKKKKKKSALVLPGSGEAHA